MKKTVLVLITFALIIAVAGSGFWLVHYFIDSREQRQTYETLAEEFVLESTPTPESTTPAENSSPTENSSETAESVSLTTATPRTTWQPWQRKMRIAWAGSPSQTRGSTTPSAHAGYPGALPAPGFLRRIRQRWNPFPGWSQRCPGRGPEFDSVWSQHDGRQYV